MKFMISETEKCIGNDVDKIQDIDTVPQEMVVAGGGGGDWVEDIQIL